MLRSWTRRAAENLFLRKQLACYLERGVRLRRTDNASRIALVWLPSRRMARRADDSKCRVRWGRRHDRSHADPGRGDCPTLTVAAILRGSIPDARVLIRLLIVDRLTMEPVQQRYRFSGKGTFQPVIEGAVSTTARFKWRP